MDDEIEYFDVSTLKGFDFEEIEKERQEVLQSIVKEEMFIEAIRKHQQENPEPIKPDISDEEDDENEEVELHIDEPTQEDIEAFSKTMDIESSEGYLILDRAAFVHELVDEKLLSHPLIALNKDWYMMANAAHRLLYDLYQQIGAKHFKSDIEKSKAMREDKNATRQ